MADNEKMTHTISMKNRDDLALEGVTNVESFNDEEIVATTDYGDLMIKGANLNVEVLDLNSGDLKISGKVSALVYTSSSPKGNFFKRVFS